MASKSRMATAGKVVSAADILILQDLATTVGYTDYLVGAHKNNNGVGGLFKIILHSADTGLDYVLEEAISEDGPFKQLDSGSVLAGAAGEINYDADGVLYGLILRLRVKHTTTAGTFGLQMSAH